VCICVFGVGLTVTGRSMKQSQNTDVKCSRLTRGMGRVGIFARVVISEIVK